MKIRQPRRASKGRKARRIVRALCAFVLAVFMMQTTVAWAFPCDCLTDDCGESGADHDSPDGQERRDGHDDKKNCPCPIDCGPCCAGAAMPAIASIVESLVLPPPLSVEIAYAISDRGPPPRACFEILRVPKPSCA